MRDGAILSGLLHGVAILLLLIGLPDIFRRELEPPPIIPIEIVNIADITQAPAPKVKPKEDSPVKEVKEEKPVPPKPTPVVEEVVEIETTSEPEKVETVVEPTPEPTLTMDDLLAPIEKEKPKEEKKEKPKEPKKEKKKDKPKKKKKKKDFMALLNNIEKTEASSEGKAQAEQDIDSTADHAANNISDVLSITERDLIRRQLRDHWNIPAGAKDAKEFSADIETTINADCTVQAHKVIKTSKPRSDPYMKAFVDSAIRALYKAGPLKIRANHCGTQKINIVFDPSSML